MKLDPEAEAGAIALCWAARIVALFPRLDQQTEADKIAWWNAQKPEARDLYRYRASVVLEAVDELRSIEHAAAE